MASPTDWPSRPSTPWWGARRGPVGPPRPGPLPADPVPRQLLPVPGRNRPPRRPGAAGPYLPGAVAGRPGGGGVGAAGAGPPTAGGRAAPPDPAHGGRDR